MGWATVAARAHADLADLGLGIGDELGNGRNWKRWVHLHDMGHADDAGNRCDVTDKIVVEFFKQRRVDRGGSANHEECVAVSGCAHDRLNADIAAAARAVLNEELLAETFRQPLTDCALMSFTAPAAKGTMMRTGRVG